MKAFRLLPGAALAIALAMPALAFDTDTDGIEDNLDNCTMVANADQRDSNADGFGNLCDADFNNDDEVNAVDLGILKANFFGANPDTDMNGDGQTNAVDLGLLKTQFFGAPGPTGAHPVIDECDCYFSGDCPSGQFCDWGPFSFTVEDNCWWRLPKPGGVPGEGCDTEYDGPPGPICDGYCTTPTNGSSTGVENAVVLAEAAGLWADALIEPSAAGGGPVDETAASAAQALEYASQASAMELGRHVADLLSMASDVGFYDYFCHYEFHPDEPGEFVDIQNDACRINSARLAIDALQAEIQQAGSGAAIVADIAGHCSPVVLESLFAPRCKPGPDALACFADVVKDMAVFVSTPRDAPVNSDESFLRRLRAAE